MKIIKSLEEIENIIVIFPLASLEDIPALQSDFADEHKAAMLQSDNGENGEPAIIALVVYD